VSGPIERFLAARVADGRMPAAAWWVENRDGFVDHGAIGNATLAPRPVPLGIDAPFDLASLTKPLVTALLLALAEQDGLLELSQAAGEYLEELGGTPWESVSLFELGTHTSGLPAWKPLCAEADSIEGYLSVIGRTPRAVEPGRALYSDLGYILLGAVLERATGRRLDELFEQRVAVPLGLARAGFARDPARFTDAAATEQGSAYEQDLAGPAGEGYAWRRGLIRGEVHDSNAHGLGGVAGHAGLFAPIGEVACIARELLRPQALPLGERARARLLATRESSDGRTMGLVTACRSSAASGILPDAAPGHTGFTGTSLWLEPAEGRLFVLLTNRVHPRVSPRNFQLVRRGFHRLALGVAGRRRG